VTLAVGYYVSNLSSGGAPKETAVPAKTTLMLGYVSGGAAIVVR